MGTLESLGQLVAPITLAHERVLPVGDMGDLFPDGGLVRGRIMSCRGLATTSLALMLVAPATAAGSWLALVDVPTVGLDAADELGVPLERIVAIASGSSDRWADAVVAAADGFDLIITRVPREVRQAVARSVASRIQRQGAVVVVLGDPGMLHCDGVLDTTRPTWQGVGDGHGHLCRRTVEVRLTGRRFPGRHQRMLQLAG